MTVTTSTMNMTTIFGPAHKIQTFIFLSAFPTSGSTLGLLIHRQANWIRTGEIHQYYSLQHSSGFVHFAADSGSVHSV